MTTLINTNGLTGVPALLINNISPNAPIPLTSGFTINQGNGNTGINGGAIYSPPKPTTGTPVSTFNPNASSTSQSSMKYQDGITVVSQEPIKPTQWFVFKPIYILYAFIAYQLIKYLNGRSN